MEVGVKERERNRESGYQNQNWENTNNPTTVGMWVWPVRDWREMVTLRPPKEWRQSVIKVAFKNGLGIRTGIYDPLSNDGSIFSHRIF